MKRRATILMLAALVAATWAGALIEPALLEQVDLHDESQQHEVMIVLTEQLDAQTIIRTIKDKDLRWEVTVSSAKELAAKTQAPLLAELRSAERRGSVADIEPMWIVNAVYCRATGDVINRVAERGDVWLVQWNQITTDNALAVMPDVVDLDDPNFTIEWNVSKVKADSVWWVHGFTGEGVIVGDIDTGCDYTHPDLADHMWTDPNYPNHGWDFENDDNDPMDSHGHGTHTCGTVAGDGTGGDSTGMAPNAQIMSCRTKTSISQPYPDTIAENTVMNSMAFCTAPPLSPENHAHLLTMSLGWIIRSWSPRQAVWRQALDNVNAAGISYFIAAGNEASGNEPINLRCPGNAPSPWKHPSEPPGAVSGSISIGATDNADAIASFSSRGPVCWDTIDPYFDYPYPPGLLKPDFSAPGVNITSTRNGGGYTQMSGTSMATPCAAGVCALMMEKNPNLLPEEVDQIMENSVLPLGTPPKNNTFGTGRIDAMLCIDNTPYPGPRHDIGIGHVLSPTDSILPEAPLAPVVVVRNRGDYREQDVTVYCRVDSAGTPVFTDNAQVTLDSAMSDTVEFSMWDVGPGGNTYDLTFWHAHPPDTISRNDTARTSTWTLHADVATANMNIDSATRTARPFTPIITLENVGGYDAYNFLVHCAIDSAGSEIYREIVEVDTLRRTESRNVSFPQWMVGPDGAEYRVTMYHDASTDMNVTNDTLVRTTVSSLGMIRIAIEISGGSRGRIEPNACYVIDSIRAAEGWGGGLVTAADVDEWNELLNFDVLVTGDDGYSDNDFAHYDQDLLNWVRRGGGFVGLGWLTFGIQHGPGSWSPMDSVSAAMARNGYAYVTSGQVRILDNDHEITNGVANFNVRDYGEYPAAGLWGDAVMLGDYSDNVGKPSIAYKMLGEGRSVYLGPIYFADFETHENEAYFTDGNALRLLVQAIKWAASGAGVGVADSPKSLVPVRHGIADVKPNPFTGSTVVRYNLARPGNVSLRVYDLTGQRVRTLVSGHEKAGQKSVTWNRVDDAGSLVPAGVYFCRFETEDRTDTRKLVVR